MKRITAVLLTILCASVFSQNIEFDDEIIGFGVFDEYPTETIFHNNTDQTVTIDSVTIDSITDLTRFILGDIVPYEGEVSLVDIELGVSFYGIGGAFGKSMGHGNIEINSSITMEPNSSVRVVMSYCANNPNWSLPGYDESRVFYILNLSLYSSIGDVAQLKIGGAYVGEYVSVDFSPFDLQKQEGNLGAEYMEINLYSANGRLVKTINNSKIHNIDTRDLSPGVYYIKVKGLNMFQKLRVSGN